MLNWLPKNLNLQALVIILKNILYSSKDHQMFIDNNKRTINYQYQKLTIGILRKGGLRLFTLEDNINKFLKSHGALIRQLNSTRKKCIHAYFTMPVDVV